MKKNDLRLMASMIICFTVVIGLTGCTSTKMFLGYFKLWGPKGETAIKETGAKEMSAFLSQARPARGNPDSHYLLATLYQQQGRHREAIEEFRKVVLIDPEHAKAYNGIGVSYDNLRDFNKAQDAYRTAMRLAPQEHYLYNNLGYSLALKGDYEAAVEILQEGLTFTPENEQMHHNLAMALAGQGENSRALAELERTNKPAEAKFALAQIHKQQGRLEDAETFFASAISLDPTLERMMPDKDRFVTRITRSIKEVRQAKSEPAKKDQGLLKTLDQPANETKSVLLPTSIAKSRTPKMIPQKIAKLGSDFLMNKALPISSNKDFDNKPQKNIDEALSGVIREFFTIQSAKNTITRDRLMGQQWF